MTTEVSPGLLILRRIAALWREARGNDVSPLDPVFQSKLKALHSDYMAQLRSDISTGEPLSGPWLPIERVDELIEEAKSLGDCDVIIDEKGQLRLAVVEGGDGK